MCEWTIQFSAWMNNPRQYFSTNNSIIALAWNQACNHPYLRSTIIQNKSWFLSIKTIFSLCLCQDYLFKRSPRLLISCFFCFFHLIKSCGLKKVARKITKTCSALCFGRFYLLFLLFRKLPPPLPLSQPALPPLHLPLLPVLHAFLLPDSTAMPYSF